MPAFDDTPRPLEPPVSILFVCLGNICRSPMAEGVFRELIQGDERFQVDSAGTGAWHVGEAPDPRAQAVCRENGILLTSRGRQGTAQDLAEFDVVVAMDGSNHAALQSLGRRLPDNPGPRAELYMLREFDPEAGEGDLDVPDPYWNDDGFRDVFQMIRRSCENLLDYLESRLP